MTDKSPEPVLVDGELTLRPEDTGDGALTRFAVELAGESRPVGLVAVRRLSSGVGGVTWTTFPAYEGKRLAQRAVRLLTGYAFGELGLARLQAEVESGNPAAARVAVRSGFRREGVLRGAAVRDGERRDVAVYAVLRDDPPPRSLAGWTALMDSVLPTKRVIAHVVVRDHDGRVLLCQVSYKQDLELPGGVVEPDEDPATGALRELEEELGVTLPLAGVLAIDWLPPWQGWGDAVEILYDGGVHDASLIESLHPDGFEILGLGWYAPDTLTGLVSPLNARRLPLVLGEPSVLHQLSDGSPISSG